MALVATSEIGGVVDSPSISGRLGIASEVESRKSEVCRLPSAASGLGSRVSALGSSFLLGRIHPAAARDARHRRHLLDQIRDARSQEVEEETNYSTLTRSTRRSRTRKNINHHRNQQPSTTQRDSTPASRDRRGIPARRSIRIRSRRCSRATRCRRSAQSLPVRCLPSRARCASQGGCHRRR